MDHFTFDRWRLLLRGAGGSAQQELWRHLEDGCQECRELVDLLRDLQGAADLDARFSPPRRAVRAAKALFGARSLGLPARGRRLAIRLTFDSFLRPARAGTRSLHSSSRHLVYRSPEFALDLRLDYARNARDLMVTGQILNCRFGPVPDAPTYLLSDRQIVARSVAGPLGEFQMSCRPQGSLALRLLVDNRDFIEVALDRRRPDGQTPGPDARGDSIAEPEG